MSPIISHGIYIVVLRQTKLLDQTTIALASNVLASGLKNTRYTNSGALVLTGAALKPFLEQSVCFSTMLTIDWLSTTIEKIMVFDNYISRHDHVYRLFARFHICLALNLSSCERRQKQDSQSLGRSCHWYTCSRETYVVSASPKQHDQQSGTDVLDFAVLEMDGVEDGFFYFGCSGDAEV